MNKKYALAAVALVLLFAGAAWALGFFGGEDREVAELRAQFENRENMTDADRDAMRDRVRNLSDGQRQQLFGSMSGRWESGMRDRLTSLQAMTPKDRRVELDRWIDDMEARRKQWEARADSGQGGPRGGRPDFENMSQAQRDQRSKERLDRTSPEMRATMQQLMSMVNDRRKERGLPPMDSPRGLFGRPGGGRDRAA